MKPIVMSRQEQDAVRNLLAETLHRGADVALQDAIINLILLFHRAQREGILVMVGKWAWCERCGRGWDVTGMPNRAMTFCERCGANLVIVGGEGDGEQIRQVRRQDC